MLSEPVLSLFFLAPLSLSLSLLSPFFSPPPHCAAPTGSFPNYGQYGRSDDSCVLSLWTTRLYVCHHYSAFFVCVFSVRHEFILHISNHELMVVLWSGYFSSQLTFRLLMSSTGPFKLLPRLIYFITLNILSSNNNSRFYVETELDNRT